MRLTFVAEYLSITPFDETEIGDFTVLTGVNGSGKSHLLDAIHQKKVRINGRKDLSIVKFNYETFKLENEGPYSAHQIASERENAWNHFQKRVLPTLKAKRKDMGDAYTTLTKEAEETGTSFWSLAGDAYQQAIKAQLRAHQEPANIGIYEMLQKLQFSPDQLEREDFLEFYKPYSHTNDFLPAALGKVIWDYYVKFRDNQVNEFENEKYGKSYPFKTESVFMALHGDRPWDVINGILKRFDTLDYEINSPEGISVHNNFTLRLLHTKKPGLQIEFSSLSSGERVLMALVASIYKISADNYFPDVLLLDELDASLHPSMIKNMLGVIRDIFLAKGLKVILVTHSPTTIALAPDEAIFLMRKDGSKRIEKTSKKEALSILTEGFATLDEGLVFFDEVAKYPVSVLTEGHNAKYINKAIELFDIKGVKVIHGLEAITGKSQLKTLYDFFSKVPHKHRVVFVWDCDAGNYTSLPEAENTYPFVIPRNAENMLATSGIENAFDESLFADFKKTIINSLGVVKAQFDETRKNDFATFVVARNSLTDFARFSTLRDKLIQAMAAGHGAKQ